MTVTIAELRSIESSVGKVIEATGRIVTIEVGFYYNEGLFVRLSY